MPYKLIPPKIGWSPYWRVRGTELGVYIDRSTKRTDRREAAEILKIERENAKRRSVSGSIKRELTFGEAAKSYKQNGGETRFLIPILQMFNETPISEITQSALDAAAATLYPSAAPATRNRQVYSPVSAILRHAGVAAPLRRPKGAQSAPRAAFLSPAEAFALLDAATALAPRFGALLTFLLYSGVRLSEGLRLAWADVDLSRATAAIRETKNGSPITVHLPPVALAALAGLPDRQGRVFRLTKSGRLYHLWAAAERVAGLSLPPRASFHVLRHTHATWRRLYTGADTSALTRTGLWKSRNAAAIYEHIDASAESRKADLLPINPFKIRAMDHKSKQ